MNKVELIEAMAVRAGLTKLDTEKALNAFIAVTINAVRRGDKVAIAGLGNFELLRRAAKVGINPATKEQIMIEAKNMPKFKPAKNFKDTVMNSTDL